MCLIVVAHRVHPRFPLVIAANRDEAFSRPAVAAAFWRDGPSVLAGRDLLHGGTWLAVSRSGRWAAVTNLRGADRKPESRSRGSLVVDFVSSAASPLTHLEQLAPESGAFGGFHLVGGDRSGMACLESAERYARELEDGVHAFSNAPAGVEWPKARKARERMAAVLTRTTGAEDACTELLQFLTTVSPSALARGATVMTDVEREPFVLGEQYGTRSSTILMIDSEGEAIFRENTYGAGGTPLGVVEQTFRLS